MTPLVLGADIDQVKIQTQFSFDAYPVGSLVAVSTVSMRGFRKKGGIN